MKTKIFILTFALIMFAGCSGTRTVNGVKVSKEEAEAMDFLYNSMSIADIGDYDESYFLDNVRVALKARDEMSWGRQVPDQLFRHFVLPVRANNERLDDFRTMYYDTLKARVAGLSMHDAALEINHWCHEKVTYTPSDGRTSSPLATMLNAEGRCGEESVFAVAAMRTVGIPARQVYTPRWAHTDDNHAWVEVWTDGKWSFLGACEPEAELNMAWFNEPAARAMLMHTLVFGDYQGDEDVIRRTHTFTEINVIGNYVKTRNNIVKVVDVEGNPVKDAEVSFCIYNYGEFYPAVRVRSGDDGLASLHTGLGDMLVWASRDGRFGKVMLSGNGETGESGEPVCQAVLVLDLTENDMLEENIDVNPPVPGNIPAKASEEAIAANKVRFAEEAVIHDAYKATFPTAEKAASLVAGFADEFKNAAAVQLVDSHGNWREIRTFLEYANANGKMAEALDILENISRKDVRDTRSEVLIDALDTAPVLADGYGKDMYARYVLCPRISGEFIQPYHNDIKKVLASELGDVPSASEVIEWSNANIVSADELNPRRLQGTPAGTLRNRKADSRSRDIFTVAALRTFGIPARVDGMTGKAQYLSAVSGEWLDMSAASASEETAASKGTFTMKYAPGAGNLDNPEYYRHFTISSMNGGVRRLLEFEGGDATELGADASAKSFAKPFTLETGTYLLTSGTRMASGKVLARMVSFRVEEGKNTDVQLVMRQAAEDISVVGSMDPEMSYLPAGAADETSIMSTTGRGYFLVAIVGAGDEPTNHALRDFAGISDVLAGWNRPIMILSPSAEDAGKLKLDENYGGKYLSENARFGIDTNNKIREFICDGCHSASRTLPVIAVCDSFGRVVYLSTGYNTSLATQLSNVIGKL